MAFPKAVTVTGNVHHEPAYSAAGASGDFDLGWSGILAQAVPYLIDVDAQVSTPFTPSVPLPAKLVGLRVRSGGPMTLILSGPGGASQAIQVSDAFYALSPGAPFSAVRIGGTGTVELLVGA